MKSGKKSVNKSMTMSPKTLEIINNYLDKTGLGFSQFASMSMIQYIQQQQTIDAIAAIQPLLDKMSEASKGTA